MASRRTLILVSLAVIIALVGACGRKNRTPDAQTAAPTDPADSQRQVETPLADPTYVPTALPTPSPAPSPTPGPPPRVIASYPIEGDTTVRPDRPLTLVFDRPVDRGSAESGLAASPATEGYFEWPSETTLVFRPTEGWTSEAYTFQLSGVDTVGSRG